MRLTPVAAIGYDTPVFPNERSRCGGDHAAVSTWRLEENRMTTLGEQAAQLRQQAIGLAQDLIRIPSLSGREETAAQLTTLRLQELGYDEVLTDQVGNAVGILRGSDAGPTILFGSHLDCVDPGDRAAWAHDPYGGDVRDGYLHGRGASDAKGALAAQIVAGHLLKSCELLRYGTLVVAGVVLAETGNRFGMQHLCDVTLPQHHLEPDLVVVGDPTSLDLYVGHRGRVELEIVTYGRTCEASAPWLGINAAYKALPVIQALEELGTLLPAHPFLERSTVALTTVSCQPVRSQTVPDRCLVSVDRRFLPTEPLDEVLGQMQSILAKLSTADQDFKATVQVRTVVERAYTGYEKEVARLVPPFITDTEHPSVQSALQALRSLGQSPRIGKWYFDSDGAYPAGARKIPAFGYSPGEEKFGHSPYDRVSLEALERAVAGNAAIYAAVSAAGRNDNV